MVGYKVGQKVLLRDGTFLNIENVQEGMSLQTIALPNDDIPKDGLQWSTKEIKELRYVSSEVNKVSKQNNEFISINELSLNDKEILVYDTVDSKFEFKNVKLTANLKRRKLFMNINASFSPPLMSKLTPLRTKSQSGLYLRCTSS